MMADGAVSDNEKNVFSTICKELEIDSDAKDSLIKNVQGLLPVQKILLV